MSFISARNQAATWRMRRANRSRVFILGCTEWTPGLFVTAGDVVQSYGLAFTAQNSGTTAGATAPNNSAGALFVDGGGVQWLHTPLLLVQPPPFA